MMNISTRILSTQDLEQVMVFDKMSDNCVAQGLEDNEDFAWGLFKNEELIGYCTIGGADDCCNAISDYPSWTYNSLLLSDVYIKPEFRHQGYALQMINEVITKRTQDEKELVFLTLLNDDLSKLYVKAGFSLVEEGVMVRDERSLAKIKENPSLESKIKQASTRAAEYHSSGKVPTIEFTSER